MVARCVGCIWGVLVGNVVVQIQHACASTQVCKVCSTKRTFALYYRNSGDAVRYLQALQDAAVAALAGGHALWRPRASGGVCCLVMDIHLARIINTPLILQQQSHRFSAVPDMEFAVPTDARPSPCPYTQMKGSPHSYSWRLTTKGGRKSKPCEHSALEAALVAEAAHRAGGRRVRTYCGKLP